MALEAERGGSLFLLVQGGRLRRRFTSALDLADTLTEPCMSFQLRCAVIGFAVALVLSLRAHAQDASLGAETPKVYQAFLTSWQGKSKAPLNVAADARSLSPQDLKDISSCAGDGGEWQVATTSVPLAIQLGPLPWIRFVKHGESQAVDPGKLIARGMPVDEAVEQGFSHALLTLSMVAFERSGQRAALNYSFVCGQLCGNGGTVLLERTPQGWVRSKTQCDTWISHSGRPNNSVRDFRSTRVHDAFSPGFRATANRQCP